MSLWRRVLTERRIVVVPLLTALAINLLVIGLAVVPLTRSVAGDEMRAGDVKLALAESHRAARIANDSKTSQVQAGEELSTFYSDVLPSSLADARTLLYPDLSALATETGLTYGSSIFEPEEVEDSPLMRYRTDVNLTGEYAGIRRFLYRLDTSEKFYVVERVALGQSGQLQSGGGSLEVVLQVATYYSRTPPVATGGGQ
jgi:Tfp pilus assembly protein PilO